MAATPRRSGVTAATSPRGLPRTQWFVVLAGGAEGIAFTPARNKTGRERIKAGVKRV
jgi:hypothetical protein